MAFSPAATSFDRAGNRDALSTAMILDLAVGRQLPLCDHGDEALVGRTRCACVAARRAGACCRSVSPRPVNCERRHASTAWASASSAVRRADATNATRPRAASESWVASRIQEAVAAADGDCIILTRIEPSELRETGHTTSIHPLPVNADPNAWDPMGDRVVCRRSPLRFALASDVECPEAPRLSRPSCASAFAGGVRGLFGG